MCWKEPLRKHSKLINHSLAGPSMCFSHPSTSTEDVTSNVLIKLLWPRFFCFYPFQNFYKCTKCGPNEVWTKYLLVLVNFFEMGELFPHFKNITLFIFNSRSRVRDQISANAKSIVRHILEPDITLRLTLERVLQHEWVRSRRDRSNNIMGRIVQSAPPEPPAAPTLGAGVTEEAVAGDHRNPVNKKSTMNLSGTVAAIWTFEDLAENFPSKGPKSYIIHRTYIIAVYI